MFIKPSNTPTKSTTENQENKCSVFIQDFDWHAAKEAYNIHSATWKKDNIEPWLIDLFAGTEWGKVTRGKEKLCLVS